MKNINYITTQGQNILLEEFPSLEKMQQMVGGYIELVKVLPLSAEEISKDLLTYMVVNENGIAEGLLENPIATKIYHNLTLKQFPNSPNPFRSAKEEYERRLPPNTKVIYTTPKGLIPKIYGDIIYFAGYTCKELEEIWNTE